MVQSKLPELGRPTIWITVGQGPTALTVGAGGGGLDIFSLIYPFFPLSPSLWETARYRLKHCLKGPLNPKQPTNQPTISCVFSTCWCSSYRLSRVKEYLIPSQFCWQSLYLCQLSVTHCQRLQSRYLLFLTSSCHALLSALLLHVLQY